MRVSIDLNGDLYFSYDSFTYEEGVEKDDKVIELRMEYNDQPLAEYTLKEYRELLKNLEDFRKAIGNEINDL